MPSSVFDHANGTKVFFPAYPGATWAAIVYTGKVCVCVCVRVCVCVLPGLSKVPDGFLHPQENNT